MFSRKRVEADCPVCAAELGDKLDGDIAEFWCKECEWFFKFGPEAAKPTSRRKKREPEKCGCATCKGKGR